MTRMLTSFVGAVVLIGGLAAVASAQPGGGIFYTYRDTYCHTFLGPQASGIAAGGWVNSRCWVPGPYGPVWGFVRIAW